MHFYLILSIWLPENTISLVIKETCHVLWVILLHEVMTLPTTAQRLTIANDFFELGDFPNCVGAVDGKHIHIQKPPITINYKKYCSIVLMAIADAKYRFIVVDIGGYGHTNDLFKESTIGWCL